MGSSRKLPFGYKMERGRIACQQEECCAVKYIFTEYQYGASFKELADIMAQKGILYDRSKPWNKNMIARILQDTRYTGADGYPVIISQDQFDSVSLKRSKKRTSSRRTEAQKVLRQKCNKTITQLVEYEVLRLLNSLCGEIEIMAQTITLTAKNTAEANLASKLKKQLKMLPADQDAAEKLIFQLAIARYEAIGNEEYETQRLHRIFQCREPSDELDVQLIKDTVSEVIVSADGSVSVRLKNNQIIGKR